MHSCLDKSSSSRKASTKNSLASLRSARGGCVESPRNPGSTNYVVDKVLWNAQAATEEDLIRVQKIDKRHGLVVLKPTARDAYKVALEVFEKDYKAF